MATVEPRRQLFGVGFYSISEAARLLRAPRASVRRWIDETTGVVRRRFAGEGKTLSFLELIELHFVKLFRDENVSLRTIRKVSQAAARKFKTDCPFAVKRFETDGRAIFATLIRELPGEAIVEDLAKGKLVFETVVKPFFRKLEYRNEAIRYWPMSQKGRVVLDPDRRFGRPIDAESGIPTWILYTATSAGGGQSHKAVAQWYGVPVDAVDAAVRFEQALAN